MRFVRTLILLQFLHLAASAQNQDLPYRSGYFGIGAGVSAAFGTHIQRLGFCLQFYGILDQFQANTEIRLHKNFRAPGPRGAYNEVVISQGILYAFGPATAIFNPFLGPLSNQTSRRDALAYCYNAYFNRIGTTQQTGCFSFQSHNVHFILENDLLARPALDRFRTGSVMLRYQYRDQLQADLSCILWTGQMGHKVYADIPQFYNRCYMDTSGGKFCALSHGILSAGVRYHAGWSQVFQAAAGIDAEQVRNAVQNHLLHDMRFIPRRINHTRNCHIPMIDSKGALFLYAEGQEPRKARIYLQSGLNSQLFY